MEGEGVLADWGEFAVGAGEGIPADMADDGGPDDMESDAPPAEASAVTAEPQASPGDTPEES